MPATMIEVSVLSLEPVEDGRIALERLAAMGPVLLLRGLRADRYSVVVATGEPAVRQRAFGPSADDLAEIGENSSRQPDSRAVARLEAVRAEHDAEWLIATEGSVASARACPGLRIICLGPAGDQQDPTRPDHRAHSLLDAARFIEAAAAFA